MRRPPTASNRLGAIVTWPRDLAENLCFLLCRSTAPSFSQSSNAFANFGGLADQVREYIKLARGTGRSGGAMGAYQGEVAGDASVPGSGIAAYFADLQYLHRTPLKAQSRTVSYPTMDPFDGATVTGQGSIGSERGVRMYPTVRESISREQGVASMAASTRTTRQSRVASAN